MSTLLAKVQINSLKAKPLHIANCCKANQIGRETNENGKQRVYSAENGFFKPQPSLPEQAQQRVLKLIFIESHYTILKFCSLKSLSPDVLSQKMTLLFWKLAWFIFFNSKCRKIYHPLWLLLIFIVLFVQLSLLNKMKYVLLFSH